MVLTRVQASRPGKFRLFDRQDRFYLIGHKSAWNAWDRLRQGVRYSQENSSAQDSGHVVATMNLLKRIWAPKDALSDDLTGLSDRRALDEFLARFQRRFTVALVEVDDFRKFNEIYGQDVSDQVLRKIARHLTTLSAKGRAFRFDGERFCLAFLGQSRKEVQPHLEALRVSIAEAGFRLRSKLRPRRKPQERRNRSRDAIKAGITVSIGVAEMSEILTSAQAVIEAAEQALCRAKQEGGNGLWSA